MPTPVQLHQSVAGDGPPLFLLHGLFGSGRNWGTIARALAGEFRVHLPDLRNHGASPWAPEMGYRAMAGDLIAAIGTAGSPPAVLVGHSMGGKVAMAAALLRPDRVARVVIADVAPVAYADRHRAHLAAMRAIDPAALASRQEADRQLAERIADPVLRGFLLQNLERVEGRFRWRLNLDAIAREMGEILGFPQALRRRRFGSPALAVRGARSDYVDEAGLSVLRRMFPALQQHTIADAGHWIHADQPQAFLGALQAFLQAPGDGPAGQEES